MKHFLVLTIILTTLFCTTACTSQPISQSTDAMITITGTEPTMVMSHPIVSTKKQTYLDTHFGQMIITSDSDITCPPGSTYLLTGTLTKNVGPCQKDSQTTDTYCGTMLDVANYTCISGETTMQATLQSDGTFAYLDAQGNRILTAYTFDNGPDYIVEGLARFVENGKIGFHDERLTKVIPAQFDRAAPFEDGQARICSGCIASRDSEHAIMTGGVWGSVDRSGKISREK